MAPRMTVRVGCASDTKESGEVKEVNFASISALISTSMGRYLLPRRLVLSLQIQVMRIKKSLTPQRPKKEQTPRPHSPQSKDRTLRAWFDGTFDNLLQLFLFGGRTCRRAYWWLHFSHLKRRGKKKTNLEIWDESERGEKIF